MNIIILDRNTQAADTAYTRDKLQSQFFPFTVPYFRRRFFQHALNAMRRDVTAAFMISHRSTKEAVYVFTAAGRAGHSSRRGRASGTILSRFVLKNQTKRDGATRYDAQSKNIRTCTECRKKYETNLCSKRVWVLGVHNKKYKKHSDKRRMNENSS